MHETREIEDAVRRVIRDLRRKLHSWIDQNREWRRSQITNETKLAEDAIKRKIRELWPPGE